MRRPPEHRGIEPGVLAKHYFVITDSEGECTPAAVEEFPPDLFTAEQREKGGIIVHFLIGIPKFP